MKKPMAPMPQDKAPAQLVDTDNEMPEFNATVRDSKGRYPNSLNVGGTHPSKKHPGARHFKD